MKAIKGLLVYIGIVLAAVFVIFFALFGIMYFVPSFRIFGVGVIHKNDVVSEDTIVLADYSNYDKVELNLSSKLNNISLYPMEGAEDITYSLRLGVFGIATDITEYRIVRSIDVVDNVLKINLSVTEPNGLISNNSSYMYVCVPTGLSYDVFAKTQSGNIILGSEEAVLNINQLTINTGSGDLSVGKLAQEGSLNLNALNLTTSNGNMNFGSIDTINVKNKILISSKNGEFVFKNVNADMDIRGTGIRLTAKTITCNDSGFTFMSDNGYFKIDNLISLGGAENTIVTENCNIQISNITGDAGIITTYGNITVDSAKNDIILESTHGVIKVGESLGDIRASSHYGDISVGRYYKSGTFVSSSGEINVRSDAEYGQGVVTKIETKDGNVKVNNKINQLNLIITGNARAEVEFMGIKSGLNESTTFQNSIKTGSKGYCNVIFPSTLSDDIYFKFVAKGNISGEISGLHGIHEENGQIVVSSDSAQFYPDSNAHDKWFTCCSYLFEGNIRFDSFAV